MLEEMGKRPRGDPGAAFCVSLVRRDTRMGQSEHKT